MEGDMDEPRAFRSYVQIPIGNLGFKYGLTCHKYCIICIRQFLYTGVAPFFYQNLH